MTTSMKKLWVLTCISVLMYSCSKDEDQESQAVISLTDTLGVPDLTTNFDYEGTIFPQHFIASQGPGVSVVSTDNTPAFNPVSNEGAKLGRVLFYDKRLSINNTISCGSCHQQQFGFSDPLKFSTGFDGESTPRHSMGLTNARFYGNGRFFWDERATTLEDQVLMPIQNEVEMGLTLDDLITKLSATSFYPSLFDDAFGSDAITSDRISFALAQFVRSLVSFESKYDQALTMGPPGSPGFSSVLTSQELTGLQLFQGFPGGIGRSLACAQCHTTAVQVGIVAENNGLNLVTTSDQGAGGGRFKTNSLRNIAVRAPYMHDGRFQNLQQVLNFYSNGIQNHPNLSRFLRVGDSPNGAPEVFNMTQIEKDALIAFLNTLTDNSFLTDPKYSDPF